MSPQAFQDNYPDDVSHCYGCGRLNPHGLRIKSYWEGDEAVCRFTPQPFHTAVPGYVYGGLIASLIDCHSTGTASAAACRQPGASMTDGKAPRFVTASLHVDYRKPTPIDAVLEVRAAVKEFQGHKITVVSQVIAGGRVCATGEVIAVKMPDDFLAHGPEKPADS
jgi:acyl-coenzyme A thioesterase PaaI-like protein